MNKKFTRTIMLSSLSLLTLSIFTLNIYSQPLSCKLTNSLTCADPTKFQNQFSKGCADVDSQCLQVACRSQCLDSTLDPKISRQFCEEHCDNSETLKRFSPLERDQLKKKFEESPSFTSNAIVNSTLKDLEYVQPQACARHVAQGCTNLKQFEKERLQGCASDKSSCLYKFCNAHFANKNVNKLSDENLLKYGPLCKSIKDKFTNNDKFTATLNRYNKLKEGVSKNSSLKEGKKDSRTYYEILGISQSATLNQINNAYKTLAMKYHPDKNPANPEEANQAFTELSNAYEVLKDVGKRKAYDVSIENLNAQYTNPVPSSNDNVPNNSGNSQVNQPFSVKTTAVIAPVAQQNSVNPTGMASSFGSVKKSNIGAMANSNAGRSLPTPPNSASNNSAGEKGSDTRGYAIPAPISHPTIGKTMSVQEDTAEYVIPSAPPPPPVAQRKGNAGSVPPAPPAPMVVNTTKSVTVSSPVNRGALLKDIQNGKQLKSVSTRISEKKTLIRDDPLDSLKSSSLLNRRASLEGISKPKVDEPAVKDKEWDD